MKSLMLSLAGIVLTLPSIFSQLQVTPQDIHNLRIALREEFAESINLLPKAVRLIFQDCAGPSEQDNNGIISICNGCINDQNSANNGLEEVVSILDEIYSKGEWFQWMSRADFWAAAATIAIEYAQELDTSTEGSLPIIPYFFGRQDCISDIANTKQFPIASQGWDETYQWFQVNLEFTVRDTVAIMGAHTLGQSHLEYSNYSDLPWTYSPSVFNNEYYTNLWNLDLSWTQSQSENGLWEYKDTNKEISMFNTDLCLIVDINHYFDGQNGKVDCDIDLENGCLVNTATVGIVQEYVQSNQLWLDQFSEAFIKLITVGYSIHGLTEVIPTQFTPVATLPSEEGMDSTMIDFDFAISTTDIVVTDTVSVNIESTVVTESEEENNRDILDKLNKYCGEYCGVASLVAVIGIVVICGAVICILRCRRCKEEEQDFNPSMEVREDSIESV